MSLGMRRRLLFIYSQSMKNNSDILVAVILVGVEKGTRGSEKMKNRFDVARYQRDGWAISSAKLRCKLCYLNKCLREVKSNASCKLVAIVSDNS